MDLAGLKKLAAANDIEVGDDWGVGKVQEALIDAGVEFELVDEPSEREQAEAKPKAAPKRAAKKSDKVSCVVICNNVHIPTKHVTGHDNSLSMKFRNGDKIPPIDRAIAEMLAARKQVTIV